MSYAEVLKLLLMLMVSLTLALATVTALYFGRTHEGFLLFLPHGTAPSRWEQWLVTIVYAAISLASCGFLVFACFYYAVRLRALLAALRIRSEQPNGDPEEPSTWISGEPEEAQTSLLTRRVPFWRLALLPFRELYGLVHNSILAPVIDRFIWVRLQRKAQGNDLAGFTLEAVSAGPLLGVEVPTLPKDIDEAIRGQADAHAAEFLSRFRARFGIFAASATDLPGLAADVKSERLFTWGMLIHNSYFDDQAVRSLIAHRILDDAESSMKPSQEPRSRVRFRNGLREAARIAGLLYLAPFALAALLILFISISIFVLILSDAHMVLNIG